MDVKWVIALVALTVLVTVCVISWLYHSILEHGRRKGWAEARDRIASDIFSAHYWFSEEPKISNTLFLIYQSLKEYGTFDISQTRDEVYKRGNRRIHP